jgi:hypothetical protein
MHHIRGCTEVSVWAMTSQEYLVWAAPVEEFFSIRLWSGAGGDCDEVGTNGSLRFLALHEFLQGRPSLALARTMELSQRC